MKKRLLGVMLTAALGLSMIGCGPADTGAPAEDSGAATTTDSSDASETTTSGGGKRVAVAMPTQSSERWINDGSNMKEKLEALGYEVDLQYAEDDVQAQVSQIENMIAAGADCLVIAAVDSSALVNVEAQAKEAGIPIIAYDRLLMDTDAVSYYATFDNKGVGTAIGKYIEESKDLANTSETYTIEFFMGSPDDNNAVMLYNGLM